MYSDSVCFTELYTIVYILYTCCSNYATCIHVYICWKFGYNMLSLVCKYLYVVTSAIYKTSNQWQLAMKWAWLMDAVIYTWANAVLKGTWAQCMQMTLLSTPLYEMLAHAHTATLQRGRCSVQTTFLYAHVISQNLMQLVTIEYYWSVKGTFPTTLLTIAAFMRLPFREFGQKQQELPSRLLYYTTPNLLWSWCLGELK